MTIVDIVLLACFGFTCYQFGQIMQIRKAIKRIVDRKE